VWWRSVGWARDVERGARERERRRAKEREARTYVRASVPGFLCASGGSPPTDVLYVRSCVCSPASLALALCVPTTAAGARAPSPTFEHPLSLSLSLPPSLSFVSLKNSHTRRLHGASGERTAARLACRQFLVWRTTDRACRSGKKQSAVASESERVRSEERRGEERRGVTRRDERRSKAVQCASEMVQAWRDKRAG
jgi:hypothetical protein